MGLKKKKGGDFFNLCMHLKTKFLKIEPPLLLAFQCPEMASWRIFSTTSYRTWDEADWSVVPDFSFFADDPPLLEDGFKVCLAIVQWQ